VGEVGPGGGSGKEACAISAAPMTTPIRHLWVRSRCGPGGRCGVPCARAPHACAITSDGACAHLRCAREACLPSQKRAVHIQRRGSFAAEARNRELFTPQMSLNCRCATRHARVGTN
jgi:hypothetical protein